MFNLVFTINASNLLCLNNQKNDYRSILTKTSISSLFCALNDHVLKIILKRTVSSQHKNARLIFTTSIFTVSFVDNEFVFILIITFENSSIASEWCIHRLYLKFCWLLRNYIVISRYISKTFVKTWSSIIKKLFSIQVTSSYIITYVTNSTRTALLLQYLKKENYTSSLITHFSKSLLLSNKFFESSIFEF